MGVDRANVIGARADQPVIVELFDDVRGPSAHPRDREDGREEVHVDAECVVGGSRIEVHIGVELLLSLYEVLDLLRVFEPLRIAARMAQVARHLSQVRGARIFRAVYAVSEARDFLLLGQHRFDVLDRVHAVGVDFLKDLEDGFVRAPVQRSLERADGGRYG